MLCVTASTFIIIHTIHPIMIIMILMVDWLLSSLLLIYALEKIKVISCLKGDELT